MLQDENNRVTSSLHISLAILFQVKPKEGCIALEADQKKTSLF